MSSMLLLSDHGEGLALGYRAALEDVLVKIYIRRGNGEVLPEFQKMTQIPNPFGLLEQFDYILADSPQLGDLALSCVDKGFRIFGCSPLSTKLLDPEVNKRFISLIYNKESGAGEACREIACRENCRACPSPFHITTWWNGTGFSQGILSYVSERLMDGERGPRVGCAGSLSVPYTCREGWVEPLREALMKDGYLGPLTLRLDMEDQPMEIHLHPHYDLTWAFMESVKNLNTFLLCMKEGKPIRLRKDVVLTLRATLPQGGPIPWKEMQVEQEAWRHIHISTRDKFCVTGRGSTISEARRRMYRTMGNLHLDPEIMYRSDIGRMADDLFKRWECAS